MSSERHMDYGLIGAKLGHSYSVTIHAQLGDYDYRLCEQTGEDHFQRDKARRIAQLDIWLKNGIIGREEYRVLKDRYERGI